jgi:hypothetical protein
VRRARGPVVRTVGADVTAAIALAVLAGWLGAECGGVGVGTERRGGGDAVHGEARARADEVRRWR